MLPKKAKEKQYWWSETGLRFECRICGKCCEGGPGSVWTTREEREEIAEFLSMSVKDMEERYAVACSKGLKLKASSDWSCIFLDRGSGRCAVYPVRPSQCREFPFWEDMLRNKCVWDFYAGRCPGMNNGRLYTPKMITDILNKSKSSKSACKDKN